MISFLNKKSIFTRLMVTYSFMSILTALCLGTITYTFSTRLYARQVEEDSKILLEQYKALVETDILNPVAKFVTDLMINNEYEDINDFFFDEVNYSEIYWYNEEIQESIKAERDLIRDVYLHNIDSNLILSAEEGLIFLETRNDYWWALDTDETLWLNTGWNARQYDDRGWGLRYLQRYPMAHNEPIKGYIVADVNLNKLPELMETLGAYQEGELLLLDETGMLIPIVGGEFEKLIGDGMTLDEQGGGFLVDGKHENYYFVYSSPFSNGWRMAMMTPVTDFYSSSVFLQRLIWLVTALCIVVGLLLSLYFARNIYSPVKEIMVKLQKTDKKKSYFTGNEYEFIDREILHLNDTLQELTGVLDYYKPMLENNILTGLLNRSLTDTNVWEQQIGLIGFETQKSSFSAVVIKVRKLILDIMDEKNLQIFKLQIMDIIREVCNNQCIVSEYGSDEIVAMVFHEEDEQKLIEMALQKKCSVNPMGSLSIGIGGSYSEPLRFGVSYGEALESLQYAYFDCERLIFKYTEFEALGVPKEDVLGRYNEDFNKRLRMKALDTALHIVDDVEQCVKELPYQYEYMNKRLLDMVGIFAKYCKDTRIKTEVVNIEERFINAERLHDFLVLFREMITDVIGRQIAEVENRNEDLIQNVCMYIEEHLAEDLSLNIIAEKLVVSEGHLSRQFKKLTDKKVVEYITERRMEQARRLLLETEYQVEKIADLSGYRTPHYFCQKFKETYGYTPTRYRDMFRQNGNQ